MFCPNCGLQLPDNYKYCPKCGFDLQQAKDLIVDKSAEEKGINDKAEEIKSEIFRIIDTMTPEESGVIRMRFGLEDGRTKTIEEVKEAYGCTRERVRQIEAKLLRKMMKQLGDEKMQEFMSFAKERQK